MARRDKPINGSRIFVVSFLSSLAGAALVFVVAMLRRPRPLPALEAPAIPATVSAPVPVSAPAAIPDKLAWPGLSLIGLLVIVGLSLAIRLQLAPTDADEDQLFFKRWVSTLVRDGPFTVYRYSDANHPPLSLGMFYILGNLYHAGGGEVEGVDVMQDIPYRDMLKIPGILFDMFMIVGAYWLARREAGPFWALIPVAAIAFNPVVIVDSSVWGQTDSIFTALTIFAIGALYGRRYKLAWLLYGLALLARFQAIIYLPLLAAATFFPRLGIAERPGSIFAMLRRKQAWQRVCVGLGIAALIVVVWMIPYVMFSGPDAWRPFSEAVDKYPHITNNAYNFWWWATDGYGNVEQSGHEVDCVWTATLCDDSQTLPGSDLSFKNLGLLMVGLYTLIVLVRMVTAPRLRNEYLLAGALAVGFFMLPTQIHERYIYPAVALFGLALIRPGKIPVDWRAIIPFLGFTTTGLYNLMLFFPGESYWWLHQLFNQVFPGGRSEIVVINLILFFATLLLTLWPTRSSRLEIGHATR